MEKDGHQLPKDMTAMTPRRIYTPIRIDFTPFVSIALLLIVFFVWVKMVQRPNQMQIEAHGGSMCYRDKRPAAAAHVFLLANNRIGFLTYRPNGSGAEFLETHYSTGGIRNQLMGITLNHNYEAIIVITPTEQATFKNLVDILDELKILGNLRFLLSYSPTLEEKSMLVKYKIYKTGNPTKALSMHIPLYTPRLINYRFPTPGPIPASVIRQ